MGHLPSLFNITITVSSSNRHIVAVDELKRPHDEPRGVGGAGEKKRGMAQSLLYFVNQVSAVPGITRRRHAAATSVRDEEQ